MLIGQLMIGRLSSGLMSLNSIWLAWMGIHGVGKGQGRNLMHVPQRRLLSMAVGTWGSGPLLCMAVSLTLCWKCGKSLQLFSVCITSY